MRPGREYESDEALIQRAGDIATTIFHSVWHLQDGKRPDGAVVDLKLRVHGIDRLRVVEASIDAMLGQA